MNAFCPFWDRARSTHGLEWTLAPLPVIGSEAAAWSNPHNFTMMRQPQPDANRLQAVKVFADTITRSGAEWAQAGQGDDRRQMWIDRLSWNPRPRVAPA